MTTAVQDSARLQWHRIMKTDWFKERPEPVRNLYTAYPPWKFYMSGTIVRRVIGVLESTTGKLTLDCVTAHIGWVNRVVGGVPPEELVPMLEWPEDALRIIEMCPMKDAFIHPSGWSTWLK